MAAKNIFGSDLKSLVENFLVGGVVKGKLANAAAVAEIDKNQLTEVSLTLNPAAYRDGLSLV